MRISTLEGSKLILVALMATCALGPVVATPDRYIAATNVPAIDVGDPKITQVIPHDPKPTRKPELREADPTPSKSDPNSESESESLTLSRAESTEPSAESKLQQKSESTKKPTPTDPPRALGQSMIACVVESTCGSDTKCVRKCSNSTDPDVNLVQRTAGCLGRCNNTEIGSISLASCYQKCIDGIFVDYPISVPKLVNVQGSGYADSYASQLRPALMLTLCLVALML